MQNKQVIINKEWETSLIPNTVNKLPTIGIEFTSFLKAIIDRKGIIAAIEKDSKIPFIICINIKKQTWILILLLK